MNMEDLQSDSNLNLHLVKVRALLENEGVIVPDQCDQFIIRCIRVKNYDVGKAAQLVKNFGNMMRMTQMQDLYSKFKPSNLQGLYYDEAIIPLAHYDSHGRLIILARASGWNPCKYDFDDVLSSIIVLFNYCIAASQETQSLGVIFILDFSGWNLNHLIKLKLRRFKMVIQLMQSSSPGKIKGIHLINHPRFISSIYMMVKPFLKTKLAKRIFFHENEKSIHQFLQPDILPVSLGGNLVDGAYVNSTILNELIDKDEYCQDMCRLGYPLY